MVDIEDWQETWYRCIDSTSIQSTICRPYSLDIGSTENFVFISFPMFVCSLMWWNNLVSLVHISVHLEWTPLIYQWEESLLFCYGITFSMVVVDVGFGSSRSSAPGAACNGINWNDANKPPTSIKYISDDILEEVSFWYDGVINTFLFFSVLLCAFMDNGRTRRETWQSTFHRISDARL